MDLEDHVVLENVESDSAIEFVSHEEAYGSGFEDVERRVRTSRVFELQQDGSRAERFASVWPMSSAMRKQWSDARLYQARIADKSATSRRAASSRYGGAHTFSAGMPAALP